jgi:hypothetical protein
VARVLRDRLLAGPREGNAEVRLQAVAEVVVDDPPVLGDLARHHLHEPVDPVHELFGIQLLGTGCGVLDVEEQHRGRQPLRPRPPALEEVVSVGPDLVGDLVRHVTREELHELRALGLLLARDPGRHQRGAADPGECGAGNRDPPAELKRPEPCEPERSQAREHHQGEDPDAANREPDSQTEDHRQRDRESLEPLGEHADCARRPEPEAHELVGDVTVQLHAGHPAAGLQPRVRRGIEDVVGSHGRRSDDHDAVSDPLGLDLAAEQLPELEELEAGLRALEVDQELIAPGIGVDVAAGVASELGDGRRSEPDPIGNGGIVGERDAVRLQVAQRQAQREGVLHVAGPVALEQQGAPHLAVGIGEHLGEPYPLGALEAARRRDVARQPARERPDTEDPPVRTQPRLQLGRPRGDRQVAGEVDPDHSGVGVDQPIHCRREHRVAHRPAPEHAAVLVGQPQDHHRRFRCSVPGLPAQVRLVGREVRRLEHPDRAQSQDGNADQGPDGDGGEDAGGHELRASC